MLAHMTINMVPIATALIRSDEIIEDKINYNTITCLEAINVIEKYSGIKLNVGNQTISYKEYLRIIIISKVIETKMLLHRPVRIQMSEQDAKQLLGLYFHDQIHKSSIVNYEYRDKILGTEVTVYNVILNLFSVKPDSSSMKLYEKLNPKICNHILSITLESRIDANEDIKIHVESVKNLHKYWRTQGIEPSENVKSFIEQMKLAGYNIDILRIAISRINDLLNTQNIETVTNWEVFEDPEEDWQEIKIRIRMKINLRHIYDKLESQIYNILNEVLVVSTDLNRIVFIKLESFQN